MILEFAGISIGDSERRTVKYTTPKGAVGTADFRLIDSSMGGSTLFLSRGMNVLAWQDLFCSS